jgi:hypothetical protein
MGRAYSTRGEKMNAYKILVGKPKGKRQLGRPRQRWEDNIKLDLREKSIIFCIRNILMKSSQVSSVLYPRFSQP